MTALASLTADEVQDGKDHPFVRGLFAELEAMHRAATSMCTSKAQAPEPELRFYAARASALADVISLILTTKGTNE